MMQLSRLQRLAIVLSAVWMIVAAVNQRASDVERAEDFAKFAFGVCSKAKSLAHDADMTSCADERALNLATWLKGSWGNVALAALAPIPLVWLGIFILISVVRAQIIGFRQVVPWSVLSVRKKAFVVLCVSASGGVLLVGVTMALNVYVDTQVPVTLAQRAMVLKNGEDVVAALGTWRRSGQTEGSTLAYPLQTSYILCHRVEKLCTEARASVSGNLLLTELVEYSVESWSTSAVVFNNDGLCITEVFTIDLKTDSVSGAGHLINSESEYCKQIESKEQNWTYRLSNGFEVYWEQRQKARPRVLRILQSFFGN